MEHAVGIHHVGVPVADLERSIRFYRDLLAFDVALAATAHGRSLSRAVGLDDARLGFAFLTRGASILELIEYEYPRGRSHDRRNCDVGAIHVALEVGDVAAEYERLTSCGVEFSAPPTEIRTGPLAGCAFAYFRDPDGIQLELFSRSVRPDPEISA